MHKRLLACGALLGLAAAATGAARADVVSGTFAGVVTSQSNSAYADGSTLSGSFTYDTSSGAYTSFAIGSYSLPAQPFTSYLPSPDTTATEAVFQANQNAIANGTPNSVSLAVDLEATNTFDTSNLGAFFASLPTTLNTDPSTGYESTFAYSSRPASGPSVSLQADITSFAGTDVPEPSSLALLAGCGVACLAARRRRNA